MRGALTGSCIAVIAAGLVSGHARRGPSPTRGAGRRSRAMRCGARGGSCGMAWYELGTAAQALEAEAVIAWNRAVRADYEQYLAGRARRAAAKKGLVNERVEEATRRLDEMRCRWCENPTVEDVRSGLALNALALDLADPEIPGAVAGRPGRAATAVSPAPRRGDGDHRFKGGPPRWRDLLEV